MKRSEGQQRSRNVKNKACLTTGILLNPSCCESSDKGENGTDEELGNGPDPAGLPQESMVVRRAAREKVNRIDRCSANLILVV